MITLFCLATFTACFVSIILPLIYGQQARHRADQIAEHLEIMRLLQSVRESQRALERPQVLPFAPRDSPKRFMRLGINYPFPPPGDNDPPKTKH